MLSWLMQICFEFRQHNNLTNSLFRLGGGGWWGGLALIIIFNPNLIQVLTIFCMGGVLGLVSFDNYA